jgi:hypothetical protein
LSDNLFDFLGDIFNENDDFIRETKILPREKNTVKVKALRKVTILQIRRTTWVKEDKTPNLGHFTGNSGVKLIKSDPTKV